MPAYDFFLEANLNSEKKKQMLGHPSQAERNYHILGVPLRTGSLYLAMKTTLRPIEKFN